MCKLNFSYLNPYSNVVNLISFLTNFLPGSFDTVNATGDSFKYLVGECHGIEPSSLSVIGRQLQNDMGIERSK